MDFYRTFFTEKLLNVNYQLSYWWCRTNLYAVHTFESLLWLGFLIFVFLKLPVLVTGARAGGVETPGAPAPSALRARKATDVQGSVCSSAGLLLSCCRGKVSASWTSHHGRQPVLPARCREEFYPGRGENRG